MSSWERVKGALETLRFVGGVYSGVTVILLILTVVAATISQYLRLERLSDALLIVISILIIILIILTAIAILRNNKSTRLSINSNLDITGYDLNFRVVEKNFYQRRYHVTFVAKKDNVES